MTVRPVSSPLLRAMVAFLAVGVACAIFADMGVISVDPGREMARLFAGLIRPDFSATEYLATGIVNTLAFALVGVAFGSLVGFALAPFFCSRFIRVGCAFVRAIHELFWALIFLQIFGFSPLTGILAIGIPYAGIIAKVYAEILDEADPTPLQVVPAGAGRIATFLFVRLPGVWPHFKSYALYRLECALRSSAVLGFIGLPTLGYHLEAVFRQGLYSQVWALLILFYVIIASIRVWVRPPLLPLYLLAAIAVLPWGSSLSGGNAVRFFTHDIVPAPLRDWGAGGSVAGLWDWLQMMLIDQALPGVISTIQLTMIALVVTGALSLLLFPLVSPLLLGRWRRSAGHVALVVLRSTPEYILAFVLLELWGPSMLPAVVALSLHNGAIIGHLIGHFTASVKLRQDAPRGLNLYAYEALPRISRPMMALLFYRWEVILRETAILGILGIATLGFYIDSAFADLRFDRAFFLILITASLNIGVDMISRAIRVHLRLKTRLADR